MEKEKILIVDDSALQATQLKSILDDDYDITIAQTGEMGLHYASTESYSLILLDVIMPGTGRDYNAKRSGNLDYKPF